MSKVQKDFPPEVPDLKLAVMATCFHSRLECASKNLLPDYCCRRRDSKDDLIKGIERYGRLCRMYLQDECPNAEIFPERFNN